MTREPDHVNIHDAKTHLSRLLARVEAGEEIVIANAGRPVARLVPLATAPHPRSPGSARGMLTLGADFDDLLPGDLLEAFEG